MVGNFRFLSELRRYKQTKPQLNIIKYEVGSMIYIYVAKLSKEFAFDSFMFTTKKKQYCNL